MDIRQISYYTKQFNKKDQITNLTSRIISLASWKTLLFRPLSGRSVPGNIWVITRRFTLSLLNKTQIRITKEHFNELVTTF